MATIKPGALLWAASAALCDMEGAILPALDARTLRSFGCLDAESFAPPLAAKLAAMPNVLLANSGAGVAPAVASNGAAPKAPAAAVPATAAAAAPEGGDALRVAFFSNRSAFMVDRFAAAFDAWTGAGTGGRALRYERHDEPLSPATAHLAEGCEAVCLFVNDDGSEDTLRALHAHGVRLGERRPHRAAPSPHCAAAPSTLRSRPHRTATHRSHTATHRRHTATHRSHTATQPHTAAHSHTPQPAHRPDRRSLVQAHAGQPERCYCGARPPPRARPQGL